MYVYHTAVCTRCLYFPPSAPVQIPSVEFIIKALVRLFYVMPFLAMVSRYIQSSRCCLRSPSHPAAKLIFLRGPCQLHPLPLRPLPHAIIILKQVLDVRMPIREQQCPAVALERRRACRAIHQPVYELASDPNAESRVQPIPGYLRINERVDYMWSKRTYMLLSIISHSGSLSDKGFPTDRST